MWFRLPAGLGAHTAAVAAILASLCLSTVAANAQCVPDPATSGQTVTCSGFLPDGFEAGAGVNNLTVTVQSGAILNDNGTAAVGLNDSNTVINNGTLNPDPSRTGLSAGNSNTVTNNGIISAISNGIAIGRRRQRRHQQRRDLCGNTGHRHLRGSEQHDHKRRDGLHHDR